ncbi:Chromatin structure remodeling complex protein sfh1 [Lecanora helva]
MTPQAFISSYAPRLRTCGNSLLTPVIPQTTAQNAPSSRTTKRGTIAINYAENEYDDDDIFEDSEGPRRYTGLRSRREDPNQVKKEGITEKLGREIHSPVEVQGIWRDWMGKLRSVKTDKQLHAPSALPLTLIPIRIDLDIPSYQPHPALPLPPEWQAQGINPGLPAYRAPEPTPPYRLKDMFLWNLHETLITPDQFATILIHDLDLPPSAGLAYQVSKQIREQLEEYAGVALHPLFHATDVSGSSGNQVETIQAARSRDQSSTPVIPGSSTPQRNGSNGVNGHKSPSKTPGDKITATASGYPVSTSSLEYGPYDTYRCIISLSINLQNKLYTDKFEWSLLHPVGVAEQFAKQTCADMGLSGEWIPAIAHAIYESVLRLKKEACESGGIVGGSNGFGPEPDNVTANGEAGWRYDDEHLAQEWEPKIERLSKEDMEKREGDRERQLRRLRRETARFSSTTNMAGGMPTQQVGYGDQQGDETPAMGRGERSKKKKRFRSLSPLVRASPDVGNSGYGGGGPGSLGEWERLSWRCSHCMVHGSAVWAVRDGPNGPRSLCNNCGLAFERDKRLPPWAKKLHYSDVPLQR